MIAGSRFPDINGCSDGRFSAEGWMTFAIGGYRVGSPEGGITRTGLGDTTDSDVFSVRDTIGAILVGSISCIVGNMVGSGMVGTTNSEGMGATGDWTRSSTVCHGVGSDVDSSGIDIGKGGIVCGFGPVGGVLVMDIPGSTLHVRASDGSGVRVIPVPGLADVDDCSDGGVPAAWWVTISAGGDVFGAPESGITGSGLGGATGSNVSRVE